MHKGTATGLLLIALATTSPGRAAPGFCDDLQRGAVADLRAAWESRLFNRDGQNRVILPAFDQAARLMRAHRWQAALPILDHIERHPTPDATRAGLDEAAADLARLIRYCSRNWLTPNDRDSDSYSAKFYRAAHVTAYSIWPRVIFIAATSR